LGEITNTDRGRKGRTSLLKEGEKGQDQKQAQSANRIISGEGLALEG